MKSTNFTSSLFVHRNRLDVIRRLGPSFRSPKFTAQRLQSSQAHWVLFNALELREAAERVHLASFLSRLREMAHSDGVSAQVLEKIYRKELNLIILTVHIVRFLM
jgi:hypothetical protein